MMKSDLDNQQDNQLDLLSTNAAELEQALAAMSQLKGDERSDFIHRWPSTLQSLSALMQVTLKKHGIINADRISEDLATGLSIYFGGRDVYIPNGESLKKALRDINIWHEFKGNNLEQLSRKYGLTERRISEIVAEQRAAYVARKQRQLF
ncbi:Mor transcription activator family protein [Shewanella xiamenensis]|uniref:Mor transcription activator family protein n=1 Tax=Shewanella xiamenensis TaxID=332186 RepID=UPI003F1949C3